MSSLTNDSAELVLRDWMKRAKTSQREGARMLARLLKEAKREQGKVQRTAQEALVSAAGMLRREVNQLQVGLKAVSQRLATFEEKKTRPARRPARIAPRRVRRPMAATRKRRSLKKAA